MIKALLGNRTVLIGLSARNIEQLQLGKPILFDLAVLGLPSQQIAVAAGATEDAIAADLTSAGGTIVESVTTAGEPERPTADDYAAAEWAITQSWQGEVGAGMAERLARFALDAAWAGRVNAAAGGASVTCPRCTATSHNPHDVAHGYCGACHAWTSRPPTTAVTG